jgi:hypothetical protein
MNAVDRRRWLAARVLSFGAAWIVIVGGAASSAVAQNTGARLTDGDATFDYTLNGSSSLPIVTSGPAGNVSMNFQLTGAPGDPLQRQVVRGNWFYRIVGDSRERFFANAATRSMPTPDYVEYSFDPIDVGSSGATTGDIWAEMDFQVFDTGPDSALVSTQVCFHNRTLTTFDIEVFLVVDFSLAATNVNDSYAPLDMTSGRKWTLTDNALPGYTGILYGPNAVGANVGEQSTIMGGMVDSSVTNYSTGGNPGGTFADGVAGLQFHVNLVPGPTKICTPAYIAIGRNFVDPPLFIPEPGGAALLAIAAALALVRRRPAA